VTVESVTIVMLFTLVITTMRQVIMNVHAVMEQVVLSVRINPVLKFTGEYFILIMLCLIILVVQAAHV
jgi:hypothetical protein